MKNLYIDIETIPADLQAMPKPEDLEFYIEPIIIKREELKAPISMKDPVKIEANIEAKWRKAQESNEGAAKLAKDASLKLYQDAYTKWHKGCLSHYTGQIVAISFALGSDEVVNITNENEKHLLQDFMHSLTGIYEGNMKEVIRWVAFNGKGFDLPYLWHQVNKHLGIDQARLIPHNYSRWDTSKVYDPMTDCPMQMSFGKPNVVSMAKMCNAYGISAKDCGMTGADVLDYFLAGKLLLIGEYCGSDVEALRELTIRLGEGGE
jgi:predicted PolB exonuclease-like 3'-5' exonuclease